MKKNISKFNKVKFYCDFSSGKINITYAISMGNSNQTGYGFKLFVEWLIEHKYEIDHVDILLSDYLHRFYVGEERALKWGNDWINTNKKSIEKLNQAELTYKIIHWKELFESDEYKDTTLLISNDFMEVVKDLAIQHKDKDQLHDNEDEKIQSAENYLFEESRAIASLKGILTYPSPRLNDAISYALQTKDSGLIYNGHFFICSKTLDPNYNLRKKTDLLFLALKQAGYKSKSAMLDYFEKALELADFQDEKPNSATVILKKTITKVKFNPKENLHKKFVEFILAFRMLKLKIENINETNSDDIRNYFTNEMAFKDPLVDLNLPKPSKKERILFFTKNVANLNDSYYSSGRVYSSNN